MLCALIKHCHLNNNNNNNNSLSIIINPQKVFYFSYSITIIKCIYIQSYKIWTQIYVQLRPERDLVKSKEIQEKRNQTEVSLSAMTLRCSFRSARQKARSSRGRVVEASLFSRYFRCRSSSVTSGGFDSNGTNPKTCGDVVSFAC